MDRAVYWALNKESFYPHGTLSVGWIIPTGILSFQQETELSPNKEHRFLGEDFFQGQKESPRDCRRGMMGDEECSIREEQASEGPKKGQDLGNMCYQIP